MSSAEKGGEDGPVKQQTTNKPSLPRTRQQSMEKRSATLPESVSSPQSHPTTVGQENSLNVKNEIVENSAPGATLEPDEISANEHGLDVEDTTAANLKSGTQYISIHFVDNHAGDSGVASGYSSELSNDNGEGICVLENTAEQNWSARISSFVVGSEADQEHECSILKELYMNSPTNESADVSESSQGNDVGPLNVDESEPSVTTSANTMTSIPTAINGEQESALSLTQCKPIAQDEVSSPVCCMPPPQRSRVLASPKYLTNSVAPGVTQDQASPHPISQVLPHPVSQAVHYPVYQALPRMVRQPLPHPMSQALPQPASQALPRPVPRALSYQISQALPHPASPALPHPMSQAALPHPRSRVLPHPPSHAPPHPVSQPYQHRDYYPVPSTHWGQHVMQSWVPYRHAYPARQLIPIDQHPYSAGSPSLNSSGEELNVSNNSAPSSTTDHVPEERQNGTATTVSSEGVSQASTSVVSIAGSLDNYQYYVTSLRENHNEKERKRRSRIKTSCQSLRALVPGLSEKTDKATVFEYTVQYLMHIKRGVGLIYDKEFIERYAPY